jgi:acetylglutamate kinase
MTDTDSLEARLQAAATLSEARPYMRRFTGKTFVIRSGGHAMGDETLAQRFARDVVLLKQVGILPVVVHGGGPQIGRMLERLKIESQFVQGLRITDAATVEIVEMVLAGNINKQIAADITAAGGRASGLSGQDGHLLRARRLQCTHRDPGPQVEKIIDLGFVGEPESVDTEVIERLTAAGIIPVIAPIGIGDDSATYNINGDTAAGAIANALGATKLLMLTDVAGVLDQEGALIPRLTPDSARARMEDGTVSGGMVPKIETCIDAVADTVEAAHILDGRIPHVLLLEIFTAHGVGTMISAEAG